jgi:RNA polymerase sigma-70 factor (ECF subfamily)
MLNMSNQMSESKIHPATHEMGAWVNTAKAGDTNAFRRLYDRFYEPVFRMIYYRTRSRSDAEDLTQEVFLIAFKQLASLKQNKLFRAWLFRIAVNRVRDHFRKKRLQNLFFRSLDAASDGQSELSAAEKNPMEQVVQQEFWRNVGTFLDRLPPMEREVFSLRFLDQLNIKEIAHVLHKGESTVKTHLYRATLKFKQSPTMLALFKEA